MKEPSVDVLLATYNGESYLPDLLLSLQNQSYQNFHVLIHDDGSSDRTREIVAAFRDCLLGRVTIFDYPPTGSAKNNFFSLLERSDSDYVTFCDQDDVWSIDHISELVKVCSRSANRICGAFGDLTVVDENLTTISPSLWAYQMTPPTIAQDVERLAFVNCVTGCCFMISAEARELVKGQDLSHAVMHDHFIALIILYNGGSLQWTTQSLALYRQHSFNQVGAIDAASVTLRQRIMRIPRSFEIFSIQVRQAESLGLEIDKLSVLRRKIASKVKILMGRK